jgi:hypothetical protein
VGGAKASPNPPKTKQRPKKAQDYHRKGSPPTPAAGEQGEHGEGDPRVKRQRGYRAVGDEFPRRDVRLARAAELPGRGFWHRYGVVVTSVCLGGVVMGALLAVLHAIDGTMGTDLSPGELFADPLAMLFAVPAGLVVATDILAA